MQKQIVCVAVALLLTGCVTMRHKMSSLHEGMSRQDVVLELGRPDGIRRQGTYETLEYSHRLITGWAWDRADYYVILNEDKVTSYGTGEVRMKESGAVVLIPLSLPQ